jgi:thiol:disulfide interchange protein
MHCITYNYYSFAVYGGNREMTILFSILITIAFGLGLPWVAVGFYFYMVHGEGKVLMSVGSLLVALAILCVIVF